MQKIYAEFCRLRDLRDAGKEAPKYTEAQAFALAGAISFVDTVASPAQGDAGFWKAPPEGVLHHALRDWLEREQQQLLKGSATRPVCSCSEPAGFLGAELVEERSQERATDGEGQHEQDVFGT